MAGGPKNTSAPARLSVIARLSDRPLALPLAVAELEGHRAPGGDSAEFDYPLSPTVLQAVTTKTRQDFASALLRLERVLDLLANGFVVLVQQLLFLFRQDSEWHAHQALLELDVQPMLTIRGRCGRYPSPRTCCAGSGSARAPTAGPGRRASRRRREIPAHIRIEPAARTTGPKSGGGIAR